MNKDIINKAIRAHFACEGNSLKCNHKLEDSVDAAKAFYIYLLGGESKLFNTLIKRTRYKTKLELIKRYINNETKN